MNTLPKLLIASSLLSPLCAQAATITVVAAGGDFLTPATWGGGSGPVPGTADLADIDKGATVTYNNSNTATTATKVQSYRLGSSNGTDTGNSRRSERFLEITATNPTTGANASDIHRDTSGTTRVSGGTLFHGAQDGSMRAANNRFAHRYGSVETLEVTSGDFIAESRVSGGQGSWTLNVSGGNASFIGSHFDAAVQAQTTNGNDTDPNTFAMNLSGGITTFSTQFGARFGGRADSVSTINHTGGDLITTPHTGLGGSSAVTVQLASDATSDVTYTISGGSIDLHDSLISGAGTSLFHVIGSGSMIDIGNDFSYNDSDATVRFSLDNTSVNGVTTINAVDVRLSNSPTLEVVLDNGNVFGGINDVDLFSYSAVQSGTFGTEAITFGGRALTLGSSATSLGSFEYFVDYANGGDNITLFFLVPEPSRALLLGFGFMGFILRRSR